MFVSSPIVRSVLAASFVALLVAPVVAQAAPAPGSLAWATQVDGPAHGDDRGAAIATNGSQVFTTGTSMGANGDDFLTVASAAGTGAIQWRQRYDGPAHLDDLAGDVAVSPDGQEVFAAGTSARKYQPDARSDRAVVAYAAADGHVVWVRRLLDQSDSSGAILLPSPDGTTVFVVGSGWDVNHTYLEYDVASIDVATGGVNWEVGYDGALHTGNDFAEGAVLSGDGGTVYVTGQLVSASYRTRVGTVALDTTDGSVRWDSVYAGPGTLDWGGAVALSPDQGTVFVSGTSKNQNLVYDGITMAYDASNGSERWHTRSSFGVNTFATSVLATPDGSRVVSSFLLYPGNYAIAVRSFDPVTGASQWLRTFTSKWGSATPGVLAASADSATVYLAGQIDLGTLSSGRRALALVAYSALDGSRRWVGRFDPDTRYEEAGGRDLVLAPNGKRAFVSGAWVSRRGRGNFLTVAFKT